MLNIVKRRAFMRGRQEAEKLLAEKLWLTVEANEPPSNPEVNLISRT
jgi:hypothetical protein